MKKKFHLVENKKQVVQTPMQVPCTKERIIYHHSI